MCIKQSWLQIILLALCSIPATASASNWVEAAVNDNVIVYIDKQSLRRAGQKVKAWVKWEFTKPKELAGTFPKQMYQASKELSIYNCADRTTLTLQATRYTEIEMVTVVEDISIKDIPSSYYEVAPDTIGEALLEFSCREGKASAKKR